MNPVTTCPSEQELQRILRGEAPPDTAEAFAGHLEQCERCSVSVEQSPAGDTLLEAMRAQATVQSAPGSYVPSLIQRLVRLHPVESVVSIVKATESGAPAVPAVGVYDFLAAPQGPDELGRLGPYRVLQVLGSGGMGIVFQAEDARLKRKVALKVIRPEVADKPGVRERFLREAQAAAALEQENIVTVYQVDEAGGVPFLAMQWLRGLSLEERLRQGGALTVPEVLRLGKQIARGLAAAHAAGLVHRDIKPGNVWLEDRAPGRQPGEYRVKILDFGLAHVSGDVGLTQTGTILGTPAYMAPEQARGEKASPRCDLFSLGVVLYRLCTGQLPFGGDSTMAVLTALAVDEPTPVGQVNPALPPALADLVMQLLAKDPGKRPASAREVAERLEAIERQSPAPSQPSQTEVLPAPAVRRARRRRGALIAAVALAVMLPLGNFHGGTIVRFATGKGVLVVQVEDPDVEVTVKQDGAVVRDRSSKREFVLNAVDGEVEVFEKGGMKLTTKKFTLARGGKVTVVVRLEEVRAKKPGRKAGAPAGPGAAKPVPGAADADQRAAQWVLSIGGRGTIRVEGNEQETDLDKGLPRGRFQLLGVFLLSDDPVTDAGLVHLKGLTNLKGLQLDAPKVSDAGLVHLKGLTNLKFLNLGETPVSDTGLAHLKGLTNLKGLRLSSAKVSDAGVVHLKGLTNLTSLDLVGTQVSGAGLAHLKGLTNLESLHLVGTQVSDAGLAHLKGLTNLKGLRLSSAKVSDPGLAHLKGLTNLDRLELGKTPVSDAGLVHLKGLTNLEELCLSSAKVTDAGMVHLKGLTDLTGLDLQQTRVTDASLEFLVSLEKLEHLTLQDARISAEGFAALKAAFPKAEIWWSEPNRTAAGAVLAAGGSIQVRVKGKAKDQLIKAAPYLPGQYFSLTRVNLGGVRKPLEETLAALAPLNDPDFDRLDSLDLSGTTVTANDLNILKPLIGLAELSLARTPVRDTELARLKPLTGLRRLTLDGAPSAGWNHRPGRATGADRAAPGLFVVHRRLRPPPGWAEAPGGAVAGRQRYRRQGAGETARPDEVARTGPDRDEGHQRRRRTAQGATEMPHLRAGAAVRSAGTNRPSRALDERGRRSQRPSPPALKRISLRLSANGFVRGGIPGARMKRTRARLPPPGRS
jgi:Leucine-rich repeat (LRR) protein/tRNA A-37 threonylcarbamoyl transferase component Bud32